MKSNTKVAQFIFIVVLTMTFLLSGCLQNNNKQGHEWEVQKQQWKIEMDSAFPKWTNDTIEINKRISYFQQSGNKLGEQAMLRHLGYINRTNSQFRPAIEYHSQSLQLSYELNDTVLITNALNELGTDFRRTGAYDEALNYHYMSLQLSEAYTGSDINSITRNIASSYNGIGVIYSAMNNFKEAIQAYEKALEIEVSKDNFRGMAMNNANIGSVYFDLGEYEKAEDYFHKSLDNNIQANVPMGIALCNINLGKVYEIRGEDGAALEEFHKAYEILSELPDKWHWIKSGLHLGEAYMKMDKHNIAWEYLDEALRTALELNTASYIQEAYELLSKYHYSRGNYKQSTDDLRLSLAYADTVSYNLEANRLLESRINYETEKYTRQIEELDLKNQFQANRRKYYILTLISITAVLIAILLIILYKRKLDKQQVEEIKKLEKMRSDFFTNLTHELRTPITVINGLNQHLMQKVGDDCFADAQDLKVMQRQGRHLIHLVNLLLDFSRSESGVIKLKWRNGDMVDFLKAIAEFYVQYAKNKGIDMFVYSEELDLIMNFAPLSIKRIMDNLLSNAIKNCSSKDQIVVHIKHDKEKDNCHIIVKDTGKGISEKDLPNIFELYYTGDSPVGYTGIGIGLALTKQLVQEMGGTIDVTSTLGIGTEFTITLPISNAPIPQDEQEKFVDDPLLINDSALNFETNDEDSDTSFSLNGNGKETILIVEDNKDLSHYISSILSRQYRVIHASNGEEGLLVAEEHIPDLIITDVMMPKKDGYAFTSELRNSVAISHIPVIMVTARVTTEDKLEGLKSGADAYIAKPFDERELLARIRQLLKSRMLLMETYRVALLYSDKSNIAETNSNMAFISKLSVIVNKHLDDQEYFPDGLTAEMHLSEAQLNRKLKAMTGHTITSFVMRARLNHAKQLLAKRNMNITEVALSSGFSDLSYFSRSFKKVFGYTPSQFIKIPENQVE